MNKFLITTARTASLAAIALSLASCEPDEPAGGLNHFSLGGAQGPLDMALQDSFGGGLGELLPAALPLLAGGGSDYGYAPSWDYANDDYFEYGDYAPQDPYDYYGYDDYYDDAGYYDQSPGSDDFMWLALAALIAGVIGDSPPDYGFDYGGVQPWAWRTGDGYYRIVEPVYGGNRYYYYEPGVAQPFLVRDPYFSYGYRDDRLVALYDIDGRVLGTRAAERQRRAAERYFSRAQDLYRDARRDERTGVYARDWERRRDELAQDRRQWHEARAEQAAWRQWDKRYEQDLRKRWQRESAAREQAARQFASWQRDSYRGPAPQFYSKGQPARVDERRGFERLALVQPVAPQRQAERELRRDRIADERPARLVRERLEPAPRVTRLRDAPTPRQAERQAELRDQRASRQREAVAEQRVVRQRAEADARRLSAQQDRVRGERQEAAERQQRAQREAVQQQRAEKQAAAERQRTAVRQQRAEMQERVQRPEQQRQAQQARAEQQRAERQAQEQQRQAQQARAQQRQAERQAQEQQRQAQQARAQQQQAERQAQQQQRQAREQERQAQQAQAQRQQAERQAREQQRQAQQAQQQARQQQAQQQQAQPAEAPARGQGRGKRDKG
jgi:hypothetical protein